MDIRKLENIMKLMRRYKISDLSIEDNDAGEKIQLSSNFAKPAGDAHSVSSPIAHDDHSSDQDSGYQESVQAALGTSTPVTNPVASQSENKKYIRSPFVGTFYSSPSPDADPFVKVGQKISKGNVLCIVEAMKLMNEIEAESSGTIVEILVNNAEPVEYDQPIFVIE